MFALDSIRDAEWMRGESFEYPKDYHPSQMVEGNFGLIGGGRPTRVRLLFAQEVARYVERRQWHPTQKIRKTERGVEMTMAVSGTTELKTWLLGWGEQVEVLEPESLRAEVAGEHARAAAKYAM